MLGTVEQARDLTRQQDMKMSIKHYLQNMPRLTDQWTRETFKDPRRQRLYLKDIDCPEAWHTYLRDILPPNLFYLNESTRQFSIPNALGCDAAPAGDLMSSLPPSMRAENLMCYVGHEGTYTPAHREMCASLGQNIMVETSGDGLDPWGQREKPGSSIWFMTETKDRYMVSEYWLSILGHDIEVESYFAQVQAWRHAPFKTYILEQKVGDFLLIPPLAPHQVWNRGTRTVKVAWNRTTVETLEMALNEALPRARMVCRDEQYKNKAIIYFTLMKYADLLNLVDEYSRGGWSAAALEALDKDRRIRQLRNDFRSLFSLFSDLLLSEMFAEDQPKEKNVEYLPFDSNVTCAYCRCNIFNRFLTCKTCVNELEDGDQDTYDVCMECYAMGRSCACISKLKWVEQFPWTQLTAHYDQWRARIIEMNNALEEDVRKELIPPPPLALLRKNYPKKTLAQVCQEQLKIRPWHDITKPLPSRAQEQGLDEGTDDAEDDGTPKRKRKRQRVSGKGKVAKENHHCHICKHREADWKLARCKCGINYCYGTLFRAFDLMPLDVMENVDWTCPRCQGICSCGKCRREGGTTPHQPLGTLVGHDTKHIADPRSVESLVDFGRSNLTWLDKTTTADDAPADTAMYETVRLRRFREEAERQKVRDEMRNAAFYDEDAELARAIQETQASAPGPSEEAGRSKAPGLQIDPALTAGDFRYLGSDPGRPSNSPTPFSQHDQDAPADEVRSSGTMLPSPAAMLGGVPASRAHAPKEGKGQKRASTGKMVLGGPLPSAVNRAHMAPVSHMAPLAPMVPMAPAMSRPSNDDAPGSSEDSRPPTGSTLAPQVNGEGEPSHAAGQAGWSQSTEPPAHDHSPPFESEHQGRATGQEQEGLANNTAVADANREFEKARRRQTLNDAKKNDSFTITQARLSGEQKVISLPLQKEHLEQLQQDKSNEDEDEHSQSDFGGDGAGDARPTGTVLVVSDAPKETQRSRRTDSSNLTNTMMDGAGDCAPPKLFGPKKKGRPRKEASGVNGPNKRLFAGRASTKSEEGGYNESSQSLGRRSGRRESAWLARKRGADDQEYPTELPQRQRKKRVLHRDETGGLSGIHIADEHEGEGSSGLVEEAEMDHDDQEEMEGVVLSDDDDESYHEEASMDVEEVEEVDDDYNPIPKPTLTTSRTNGTRAAFSQLYQNDALNAALAGTGSSTKTKENGIKSNGNSKKRSLERSSDPYQDAKMMALRMAEGEITDIASGSGSGSESESIDDDDEEEEEEHDDDDGPPLKKPRMIPGTVKPGSYLRDTPLESKRMMNTRGASSTKAGMTPTVSITKKSITPRAVSSSSKPAATAGPSTTTTTTTAEAMRRVTFSQQSIFNRPGTRGKKIKIVSEARASRGVTSGS